MRLPLSPALIAGLLALASASHATAHVVHPAESSSPPSSSASSTSASSRSAPPTAAVAPPQPAAQAIVYPTTPRAHPQGRKWRLGYFESGDYSEYPRTLRVVVAGLQQLGWLQIDTIPDDLDGRSMWSYIAHNARSQTLEFVDDAWWQPGQFDASKRPAVRAAIAARLRDKGDIDLIIAMGTLAGQDMATLGSPVPTIVGSASDAVAAKIVQSVQDSGQDNLHARVQPERYQRQVRLFHDIVPFKTLGLVYEDSPEGRTYAAVDAVTQVAHERGFTIQACDARSNGIALEQATANMLSCYAQVAPKVDAVYVTVHRGITPDTISSVGQVLRDAQVPSFAMLGSEEVKKGLLMSLSQADYSYVGLFYAETIARIFNGAKPRALSQIWVDPAKIALNLETARLIGFDPPIDILLAADEVYETRVP